MFIVVNNGQFSYVNSYVNSGRQWLIVMSIVTMLIVVKPWHDTGMIIGYTDIPSGNFTNIAIENGPVATASLPMKSMLIFHSYKLPEGTSPFRTFTYWEETPKIWNKLQSTL